MTRREWEGTDGEEEGTGRSREREEKGEKLLYVAGRCGREMDRGSLALPPTSGLRPLSRPGLSDPTLRPCHCRGTGRGL